MQNAFKHQTNTLKAWMQQDNMTIHAKLSKFHIEHAQNGATVQHIQSKQDITTIYRKQQVGTSQTSKQDTTGIIWSQTWHALHVEITHFKYN